MINAKLQQIIEKQLKGNRKITFLTGAGISAESGIPTFRGKDGFWTDDSKNYTPQEIGTRKMFEVNCNEVWRWYLYRISICNNAIPNKGHVLLSQIEHQLLDRFSLISQNVDGLHFRPQSKINNLYLIHGDLRFMRCSEECTKELFKIPKEIIAKNRTPKTKLLYQETQLLRCPNCGEVTRPHVLWFDEYYNDKYYYLDKVLRITKSTGLLIVIGTSGATNLPWRIVENTLQRQGIVIDVNPNENEFTEKLERVKNGYIIKEKSSNFLEEFYELIKKKTP